MSFSLSLSDYSQVGIEELLQTQAMADQFVLRRAIATENVALSQLFQQCTQETFIEDLGIPYPKQDIDFFFRSSASPESLTSKICDPLQATWVVEDKISGELVAFATVGPCKLPHPDVRSAEDGELHNLYVRRDRQGYGLGQRLMNVILLWLEERYPERPIWLGVWSGNIKAQKFYAHYGFHKVGEYCFTVGDWKDNDFIMRRESHSI